MTRRSLGGVLITSPPYCSYTGGCRDCRLSLGHLAIRMYNLLLHMLRGEFPFLICYEATVNICTLFNSGNWQFRQICSSKQQDLREVKISGAKTPDTIKTVMPGCKCGAPQGSILHSLLFLIHLKKILRNKNISAWNYLMQMPAQQRQFLLLHFFKININP